MTPEQIQNQAGWWTQRNGQNVWQNASEWNKQNKGTVTYGTMQPDGTFKDIYSSDYMSNPDAGITPISASITPASLQQTTPTNFQTTPQTGNVSVPPPPTPESTVTLSPEEQRVQDAINQAQETQTSLAGKSAYTTEQQTVAGVPEQQKLIRDLNAQLIAAHNEANAIPLKTQAGAEGRGITAGGLAPITAGLQRQNAIKILETNSTLAAAQGNLQNAMDLADRAVTAKYGPIEESLKAQLANLDIIQKSPAYDAATKKRATEAQAKALQTQNDLATQKKNETDKNDLVTKIIANNPTITQDNIAVLRASKDPVEAAAVASHLGLVQEKPTQTATTGVTLSAGQTRFEINKKTGQLEPVASVAAKPTAFQTGAGGVSQELQDAINNGTIDPNRVNSRTIGLYNELAKGQVNASQAHADISAKTKAYEDAVRYSALASRTTSVLDKNMPLLEGLADKVNTLGVPIADKGLMHIASATTNNPDVIKYVNTINTIRAEYANMLAKGTQVTESMRKDAQDAVPIGLTGAGYTALMNQLKLETANIISSANDTANLVRPGQGTLGLQNESTGSNVDLSKIDFKF